MKQLGFFFMMLAGMASATDNPTQDTLAAWSGSKLALSGQIDRGNSHNDSYTVSGLVHYQWGVWFNDFNFSTQFAKNQSFVTKEKYALSDQINYGFAADDKRYIFVSGSWERDLFSAFRDQYLLSSGFGYYLIDREHLTLTAQLGPGYRYNTLQKPPATSQQAAVLTTLSTLTWSLSDAIQLSQSVAINLSKPYTFAKSISALTDKLTTHLALQCSYTLSAYTSLPKGSRRNKKVDSTLLASLIFGL